MNESIKEKLIEETWDKAKMHSKASKVGIPMNLDHYTVCPCCDQIIEKFDIPLEEHTKEFERFGFGYSLWFSFLKYCIFLVIMLIASKTASELYRATKENYDFCYGESASEQHENIGTSELQPIGETTVENHGLPIIAEHGATLHLRHGDLMSHSFSTSHEVNNQKIQLYNHFSSSAEDEHPTHCTSFMVYFSLFKEDKFYEGTFLRIVEFLIHLIALIYVRNMILKEEQYFDERTTSLSDYSVIVSNLPEVEGNRKRLSQFFKDEFNMTYGKKNSTIKEMIFIFKSEKVHELQERKSMIEENIRESINDSSFEEVKDYQKELNQTEKELNRVSEEYREKIEQDKISCTKMIVVFNTEAEKAEVVHRYSESDDTNGIPFQEYFEVSETKGKKRSEIAIKEAPEPNEIIWEHIDESDENRKVLILKGYLLTFLFLLVITVIFYLLLLAKTRMFISAIEMEYHAIDVQKAHGFKIFATVVVFIAMFGIVLFNKFVMGQVLHKIVHHENHAFTDKENHSFALKYALGMFFTTALMTLAVEAITFRNFYSHQFGVIEEETIMFFVTAFLIPLIWYIHPYNLHRKLEYRSKKNSNELVSQEEANELSEYVAYDLGKRYAEIFEIMWFTFLYSELIPLGSFLVLIGLTLYYWVDKYNFLRKSVLKAGISGKMAILGLKSLDVTLFLPSAGQLLFDWILRESFDPLACILTILGILYMFVPISDLIWYFNSEKFYLEQKSYENVRYNFAENYYTLHPVYKLAYHNEIRSYKQRYSESLSSLLESAKVFGFGRGTYKKDSRHHSLESEIKRTTMTTMPESVRSQKTTF